MASATPTSSGVWTPRYIRLKQISTITARHAHRSHGLLVYRAVPPNSVTAFCVWPLGNEYPDAPARALSTMVKSGSLTHGRGTAHRIFRNWLRMVPKKPTVIR